MSLDSDVALLGTGIAPLIAASHLLAQGKSVLLLNPDRDYFLEDSELPLDPLIHDSQNKSTLDSTQIIRSSPESVLAQLRPDFPGAIELGIPVGNQMPYDWTYNLGGFHDLSAPHVRQRGRLWISSSDQDPYWNWEKLDTLFVESSDLGLKPQILDDLGCTQKFPGCTSRTGNLRGVFLPKLCDVDLFRYRNGLLEFIRERLPPERVVCGVNQLERMPQGVRFNLQKGPATAKLNMGMLVFWTPHMSSWILNQAKKAEIKPKLPLGTRLWEQWTLPTRQPYDPRTIGIFGNMAVWADFEGLPSESNHPPLAILRAGPLFKFEDSNLSQMDLNWASSESFNALSNLCHGFLKWDKFSVRGMRARTLYEWEEPQQPWKLSHSSPLIQVIPGCDGPLVDVIQTARSACNQLLMLEEKE